MTGTVSPRWLGIALGGVLLPAGAGASTTPAHPVAARAYLADGRILDGVLLGGDADSLVIRAKGQAQDVPLATLRLVSFGPDDGLARDREWLGGSRQGLALRSGGGVSGRFEGLVGADVVFTSGDGRASARYPVRSLRRIWIDASGFDFDLARGSAASTEFRVSSRTREGVERVAQVGSELRQRLLTTAHRDEPFEQRAIGELVELEARATELASVLAAVRPDPDAAFRATELLLARTHEVDRAIDALHAYESVRGEWARVRDFIVPEVSDGMNRAFRGAL